MYYDFAFIGTGACNENKTLIEISVTAAVIAGWLVISYIIRKINISNKSLVFKTTVASLLIGGGIFATALVAFSTWLGLACSG